MSDTNPIAILGAGASRLAMASHLALNGASVRLWNRSAATLGRTLVTKQIECSGEISGVACLDLVTTDIAEALEGVELLLITAPAHAHADLACLVAPFLNGKKAIILNPGRTFGAVEFAHVLRAEGVVELPTLGETQTIVYTCRKTSRHSVIVLKVKHEVLLGTLHGKEDAKRLIETMPECLRLRFVPAEHWIETSIGNVGMILHCLPTLLNAGWIESPRAEFKYYYDGITPSIATLLEKLDRERVGVAKSLGHPVETTMEWFSRSYGVFERSLFDCVQKNEYYRTIDAPATLSHRYLLEDVPCGLVPLEAIGKAIGLRMPVCGLAVDLACAITGKDFRNEGRSLARLGLTSEAQTPKRLVEFLMRGDWSVQGC